MISTGAPRIGADVGVGEAIKVEEAAGETEAGYAVDGVQQANPHMEITKAICIFIFMGFSPFAEQEHSMGEWIGDIRMQRKWIYGGGETALQIIIDNPACISRNLLFSLFR